MSIINSIKNFFSIEEQEIKITYKESADIFKEKNKENIDSARNKRQEIIDETYRIIEDMEKDLEKMSKYSDEIEIVEKVLENFVRKRKRLINNFDPSNDIKKHKESIDKFIDNFNDVSGTEVQVMKRVEKSSDYQFKSMERLIDHSDAIENFIDEEYIIIEKLDNIKNLIEEIESLQKEIKELQKEIDNNKVDRLKSNIEELETKIEKIENSKEWKERQDLKNRLEKKRRNKNEALNEVSKISSEIERGLRKLIYEIKNGNINFNFETKKLKKLSRGEFRKINNLEPLLKSAINVIEKEDLIGDRKIKNFDNAIKKLTSQNSLINEIEKYEKEIKELEEKIDSFQIENEKKKLKKEIESHKKRLEKTQNKIEKIETKIDNKIEKKEKKKEKLKEILNSSLDPKISLK